MHMAYLVKDGDDNQALRYSLRSLRFLNEPVDSISISGYTPDWIDKTKVLSIDGNKWGDKWHNVFNNARLLAEHPDVPDEFVDMNDDFFILRPNFKIEMEYRCPFDMHLRKLSPSAKKGEWGISLITTWRFLTEELHYDRPKSFELHKPFPVIKEQLETVMDICSRYRAKVPPQWRSVYGMMYHANNPYQVRDSKVYRASDRERDLYWLDWDMVSSDGPRVFGAMEKYIHKIHSDPSPWELDY